MTDRASDTPRPDDSPAAPAAYQPYVPPVPTAPQAVMVPLEAVIAIYSRETGQGMAMPDEPRPAASQSSEPEVVEQADDVPSPGDAPDAPDTPPEPPKRGGHLRIVK